MMLRTIRIILIQIALISQGFGVNTPIVFNFLPGYRDVFCRLWERHKNPVSWVCRPFFGLLIGYGAILHNWIIIVIGVIGIGTSWFWFPKWKDTPQWAEEFIDKEFNVLTPDKARADWGGTAAPAPPTVSNLPQPTPVPPTLAAPPGLYVTGVRLEPGPQRGVDIGFYPMFLNTTGGTQTYRVKVYLYRAENMRNSYGETSTGSITIPVGSTEQKGAGSWKLGGGGGCEDFVARVGWIDDQNRITYFNAPAGGTFESRFSVCP